MLLPPGGCWGAFSAVNVGLCQRGCGGRKLEDVHGVYKVGVRDGVAGALALGVCGLYEAANVTLGDAWHANAPEALGNGRGRGSTITRAMEAEKGLTQL